MLPPPAPEIITEMVEDYKHRHRKGEVKLPEGLRQAAGKALKLAGGYSRYSCDNSTPASIGDQMVRWLRRAKSDGYFVPWCYNFADYSVSGLDSSRCGYSAYKAVLADDEHQIRITYIDDFSRASRDHIEWWKLAALSKRLRKGLIGASDGFDLNSEHGEILMFAYALLSRLFMNGLNQKVKRGMAGAAHRRRVLGKLPLGFTRKIKKDAAGNVILKPNGSPAHEKAIDPETMHWVTEMFELYAIRKKSPGWIARHFVAHLVDGWDGWTRAAIIKLLTNPAFIGLFIWNRTRREFNGEGWDVVPNPRPEWEIEKCPDLRIIPRKLWGLAKRRLRDTRKASVHTGKRRSRNQNSATTLFSGTLFCGYCKEHHPQELKLFRSTEKYKNMYCLNGTARTYGCRLTTSKSTRHIEGALLRFLEQSVISEATVEKLVADSNEFLRAEAIRPRVSITPLRSKVRELEGKINKLVLRIENSDNELLCESYDRRIKQLQRELNDARQAYVDACQQNMAPPPPLDATSVKSYLGDLRALLHQDIPAAAEAIRQLTGEIHITQEEIPGRKRGAKWIATFSPDFLSFLTSFARSKDCPERLALEYLKDRIWINPTEVTVEIYDVPKYEALADEFRLRHQEGASTNHLALEYGISWKEADEILNFALTGQRPKHSPKSRSGANSKKMRYKPIADEVVYRRDKLNQRFDRIAREMRVGKRTVRRAYYWKRPEMIGQAHESLDRLDKSVFETIKTLLDAGVRDQGMIAKEAGCSTGTVRREMIRLRFPTKRAKKVSAAETRGPKRKSPVDPRTIVDDVVRMKDIEKKTFSEIAIILKVGFRTVEKAYDFGRPDLVAAAAALGEPTRRARNSRLGPERKKLIAALAADGATVESIMAATGCSKSTAVRARDVFCG